MSNSNTLLESLENLPPDELGHVIGRALSVRDRKLEIEPPPDPPPAFSIETMADAWPHVGPLKWIWRGWLPRTGLVLFNGIEGTGKTTLSLRVAAEISNGKYNGLGGVPGRVAIWTDEDHPGITLGRMRLYGANMGNIIILGRTTPFVPAEHIGGLLDRLEKDPIDVLMLDPLMSLVVGDNNNPKHIRDSLQPVIARLTAMGTTLLGIGHWTKDSHDRAIVQRHMGSGAYTQLARAVWAMVSVNDRLLWGKGKVSWGDRRGVYEVRIDPQMVDYEGGDSELVGVAHLLGQPDVDRNLDQVERSERAKEREDATEDNDTAKAILDTLRAEGGKLDRLSLIKSLADEGYGRSTADKWLGKLIARSEVAKRKATPAEKGNKRNLVMYELPPKRSRHGEDG